jgi:enoyl-CoA hydratase/carnithine racemase
MTLRVEDLAGGARRLTLDRPAAANALDSALHAALVGALDAAAADGAVRAVLLAGAGGRVFCAGADLKEALGPDGRALRRAALTRTLLAVLDCPKPVIAVLRGKAVGGGAMLALLADEVAMAEGASLSMPEIGLGLPSPIGAAIVAARGGRAAAQALVQGREAMGASAALAARLADAALPDAGLDDHALARAALLGALPPAAYAANKAWINAALRDALLRAEAHAAAAHAREAQGAN